MLSRHEKAMTRAALAPRLSPDQQREARLAILLGEEERITVQRAMEAGAAIRMESQERERCLAICQRYAGGSLTVQQIIREIQNG